MDWTNEPIKVEILVNGEPRDMYRKNRRIYIVGNSGVNFAIRLTRQTEGALELLVTHGGLGYSTLNPGSYTDRGIFLVNQTDPHTDNGKVELLTGFQVGPLLHSPFVFDKIAPGGRGHCPPPLLSPGTIAVAVFSVRPTDYCYFEEAEDYKAMCEMAIRQRPEPDEVYHIRYDSVQNLVDLGIRVNKRPVSRILRGRERVDPFPGNTLRAQASA